MKKSLLSIFCAVALTSSVMADEIALTFITTNAYEGTLETVTIPKPDGDAPTTLNVGNVCDIDLSGVSKIVIETSSTDNSYLQLSQNSTFKVIPAEGVTITAIDMVGPSKNYWNPISATSGTGTDVSNKEYAWSGSSDSEITFNIGAASDSTKGTRFVYWVIAYTKSGESGVASIAVENDAPVKYYNLQGMEVVNPEAGSIVICKQGSTVKKFVVK